MFAPKRTVIFMLLSLLLCSCVATQIAGRSHGEDLKESAMRYWTYRMDGDLYKAYDYEHVAYTGMATRQFYMKGFGGSPVLIKGFEIMEIGGEGAVDGYTPVQIKMKLSWPAAAFKVKDVMEIEIRDLWVKKEGKWYHIQQQMTGFY